MKIAVIGYSGSGKSTLSRRLGRRFKLPVLFLDQVHWLPGWKEQEPREEAFQVEAFMDDHDSWVIDGNYSRLSFQRRMEEADHIIFMNFNRFACFMRILRRYVRASGRSRPSMTRDCPEKLDREFIRWILHDGRTRAHKKSYANVKKSYGSKVIVIKNQKQLSDFMKGQGIK